MGPAQHKEAGRSWPNSNTKTKTKINTKGPRFFDIHGTWIGC